MSTISYDVNPNIDIDVLSTAEERHSITMRDDIKQFIISNAGGYPRKLVIIVDGEEYEVRVFLSLDKSDSHYFIGEWLNDFLSKTKGRIVPIAIDSENNVYCVNNETGKVYYWSFDADEYYYLAENLECFSALFT